MEVIPLTVEIHWHFVKETTANFQIESCWQEAVALPAYHYVKRLLDYHTFYMICLHGWRHNLDSPKYVIDLIQLIVTLGDRLCYERLLREAKAH